MLASRGNSMQLCVMGDVTTNVASGGNLTGLDIVAPQSARCAHTSRRASHS